MKVKRFLRRFVLLTFLTVFIFFTVVFVTGGRKEKLLVPSFVPHQIQGVLREPRPPEAIYHAKPVVLQKRDQRQAETITIDDVVITVKTTEKNHNTRVQLILETWNQQARNQIYFITDAFDEGLTRKVGAGHVVATSCDKDHARNSLCCKMQAELDTFLKFQDNASWFCHFDDDSYVNIPQLIKTLRKYNESERWYLGKRSRREKISARDYTRGGQLQYFWFGTGGAGICFSRNMLRAMTPHIIKDGFRRVCPRIRLPDDCAMGFIAEVLLNVSMINMEVFHSHLEQLHRIRQDELPKQVSFGYDNITNHKVKIQGFFDVTEDPTRIKSLHCLLFPETSWCPASATQRPTLKFSWVL